MEVEPTSKTNTVTALPFKRVVIYKNGVAYFEREGKIQGNCAINLNFKPNEMNDIIRSLRAVDLEGGKIANISYESPSPPEQTPDAASLNTALFKFLIGSNVSITANSDKIITGRVVGTSNRHEGGMQKEVIQLLVDNSKIHFIDTAKISSMEIIDAHVTGNVKENLDSVLNAKKKDTRQVSIVCKGTGSRSVRISYILENPIWKSNYRIYMKHAKEGNEKQFFLEGWACVDNISEYDWDEVSLALVSGSPISFQHEVYNPVIGVRPANFSDEGKTASNVTLLQANNNRNISPINNILNMNNMNNMNNNMNNLMHLNNRMQHQQQLQQMQQMQSIQQMQSPAYPPPMPSTIGQGVDIESQTVEIGNLFHYEIQTPITVKKDHSSLVPTVSGAFKGRQICWFDPKRHAVNPMECIMLKNTLGTILDKGPVIITEDESYLGESIFENTLMQEEHKVLPYSVNLECKISKTQSSNREAKHTNIRSGTVYITLTNHNNTAYTLANNSEHEIELALDHEEYVAEKVPEAKAQAKWKNGTRFYVILPPLKKTIFNVHIATTVSYLEQQIVNFSEYEIARIVSNRYFNKAIFDTLMSIYSDARQAARTRSLLEDERAAEEQIISDQKRIQSLISHGSKTNAVFEQQIADLEAKLAKTRRTYSEKFDLWESACTAVHARIQKVSADLNLETEKIPGDFVSEVNSKLQSYHRTTMQDLLSETHNGNAYKRKRIV